MSDQQINLSAAKPGECFRDREGFWNQYLALCLDKREPHVMQDRDGLVQCYADDGRYNGDRMAHEEDLIAPFLSPAGGVYQDSEGREWRLDIDFTDDDGADWWRGKYRHSSGDIKLSIKHFDATGKSPGGTQLVRYLRPLPELTPHNAPHNPAGTPHITQSESERIIVYPITTGVTEAEYQHLADLRQAGGVEAWKKRDRTAAKVLAEGMLARSIANDLRDLAARLESGESPPRRKLEFVPDDKPQPRTLQWRHLTLTEKKTWAECGGRSDDGGDEFRACWQEVKGAVVGYLRYYINAPIVRMPSGAWRWSTGHSQWSMLENSKAIASARIISLPERAGEGV